MGFKQSVVATNGCSLSQLVAALGFGATQSVEDDGLNFGVFALQAGEWAIVAADGGDHIGRLTPELAAKVDAPVVVYFMNYEVSMDTEFRVFSEGTQQWRLHVSWEGETEVTIEGAMPPELRDGIDAANGEVAYAIPQDLLEGTTGFDLREKRTVRLLLR